MIKSNRKIYLNFRQNEENHIMGNILFNELTARGFRVDVGFVPVRKKDVTGQLKFSFLFPFYKETFADSFPFKKEMPLFSPMGYLHRVDVGDGIIIALSFVLPPRNFGIYLMVPVSISFFR